MLEKLFSPARAGLAALCIAGCATPLQKNYHLYPREQQKQAALHDINAILDYTDCKRPGNPEISDAAVNCLYEDKCSFMYGWTTGPGGKAVCDRTGKEIVVLGRISSFKSFKPEPFWREDKENCLDYDGTTIGPEVYCNITTKNRQQAEDLVYAIQVYAGLVVPQQPAYASTYQRTEHEKQHQRQKPQEYRQQAFTQPNSAEKDNKSNDAIGYLSLSAGILGLSIWLLTGETCHNSECQRNISKEGETALLVGGLALTGLGLYLVFD